MDKLSLSGVLEAIVKINESIGQPSLLERFVLRNGRAFERGVLREPLGTPKQCYMNATHYAQLHKTAKYVEGYAVDHALVIPMQHAWVVSNGKAIDPTWGNRKSEVEYFGVEVDDNTLRKTISKTGHYGLFAGDRGFNYDFIYSIDPELRDIVDSFITKRAANG